MPGKDFWRKIKKPIIALAPMENYTDSSFRRVCKMVNPGIIAFTEFTSADGLHYNSRKTRLKISYFPEEQPLIAQIFGKSPESFITAAKFCEDAGFSGIDINMGCPVRKVFRAEHGVALRRTPALAFRLIEAVARNTSLPVSVKTRLGLENADDLSLFAQGAERAGADLITVHARTYREMYSGPGNWMPIYELKRDVGIPVVGNGGINSLREGYERMENLDGFMIGRAARGNPWVFAPSSEKPRAFSDKAPMIKLHAKYLIESKGERVGTLEIRNHLLRYVRDIRGAAKFRVRLTSVGSFREIEEILDDIISSLEVDELNSLVLERS